MGRTTQTITINGKLYDASTGKLLGKPVKTISDIKPHTSSNLQSKSHAPIKIKKAPVKSIAKTARKTAPTAARILQQSKTLRRTGLKKPTLKKASPITKHRRSIAPQKPRIVHSTSSKVQKFVKSNTVKPKKISPITDAELKSETKAMHTAHAHHQATHSKLSKQKISSRAIKERLLEQQLHQAVSHKETPHQPTQHHISRRWQITTISASSFALVVLAAYLTYVNIPNLSIKIASANAGISASLPNYQPSGFHLNGPISYSQGQVDVSYKQAGGKEKYTLIQRMSSWDPQALLDNLVVKEAKDNYQIHSANGLTIYTYGDKATWVNGGILHIINGNTPLSSEQIARIANSI